MKLDYPENSNANSHQSLSLLVPDWTLVYLQNGLNYLSSEIYVHIDMTATAAPYYSSVGSNVFVCSYYPADWVTAEILFLSPSCSSHISSDRLFSAVVLSVLFHNLFLFCFIPASILLQRHWELLWFPMAAKQFSWTSAHSVLKVAITLKDLNRQEMWPH